MDVDQDIKRFERSKASRLLHENVWRDCFDYSWPARSNGFESEVLDAQSVQDRKARMLDTTATDAGRILASGVVSGSTPANSRWFGLESFGADDAGKRWLDTASQTLFDLIHSSNFDSAAYECAVDLVGAGWFALYVEEDREKGGFRFEQWPLAEVYCAESRSGGMIDIVYRAYSLSAEQAIREFGEQAVSQKLRDSVAREPDAMWEFLRCIKPRKMYVVGSRMAKTMPIESRDIEMATRHVCREQGYLEHPVMVPRWMRMPRSVYATGPMSDALPAIRELNYLKYLQKANLDMAVSGMWIAADDGVLNARSVKVGPRKIIVANSVDSMKPLTSGVNFDVSFVSEERLQAEVRRALMADQLQPQDGPAMTATEVNLRVALIRQMLGPVYARMQSEYLQPLIERCFGLALRAGVFGQPPASLAGRDLKIKYMSPLARAQRLEEVVAIERFNANMANILAAMPSVVDLIDGDEMTRVLADSTGLPRRCLIDEDAVQALRDQRAEQAAAAAKKAEQAQMQGMAAQAAMKAA